MSHIGVDTIGADVRHIPITTPSVFGYVTGSPDIRWSGEDFGMFPHSGIGRINQDNDTNPNVGTIFDLESHAGTVWGGTEWAQRKQRLGGTGVIYISRSVVGDLEASLAQNGVDHYELHIADWDLSEDRARALLGGRVKAVQFASPTSNPHTILPGSHLTLAASNCDLSVCADDYFPPPHPRLPVGGVANAQLGVDLGTGHWHAIPAPGHVVLADKSEWWEAKVGINRHTGQWRVNPLPAEER